MIKSIIAISCTALLTCGLQAQVGGSINRSAPKVSNTIEMGGNKLHVEYTAIRFGEGEWQKVKDNADSHERFNKFAESSPLGKVHTSCDLMAAGKKVPAGKYDMFFTINDRAGWILNLKPAEGDAIRWRLVLQETDDKKDCMKIALSPTSKNNACALTIAFGMNMVKVPVMIEEKKEG